MVQLTNPLLRFTESLWAGGDLVLVTNLRPSPDETAEAMGELRKLEAVYRLGLPDGCPEMQDAAAVWALTRLYRACQYLVFRELPEDQLRVELGGPFPGARDSSACYSVDLSFRFLPEIIRLSRSSGISNVMLESLREWATAWPLSSVGIPDLVPGPLEPIWGNSSLLILYVDRIVASNDLSRLADARIADAVRAALGGFRDLSPALYDVVNATGTECFKRIPSETSAVQPGVHLVLRK